MRFTIFVLVCALAIMSTSARAIDLPPVYEKFETDYGDLYGWGIASQGYVWADQHSFFGSQEDPFGCRDIRLGGRYQFLDRYSVTVQGGYRSAGESDSIGLRLGQAYVNGNFTLNDEVIVGANLGRIEVPFGFYNRTRDRVDTRPSIVLPQSIYLDGHGLQDYILNGDGGMAYGLYVLTEKSRLETKVAVVNPPFGEIAGLEDALLLSGWIDYIWDNRLRLRLTLLDSEQDETSLTYPVLSGQFMWDRWTFTSEWGRLQFDTPFGNFGTDGVYGQVEYAVTGDLTLFGRYDYLRFDVHTPVPLNLPDDRLRAQSLAVGLGYDINRHVRANMEYHIVDGTAFLNGAENPSLAVSNGSSEWGMFLGMVSVRF